MTLKLSPFLGRIEVYEEYVAFDRELFGPYDENAIEFAND
jgi:hypothetical protein